MTLKELHDKVPEIVAANLFEVEKATKYAQDALLAAEDDAAKEEAKELIQLIQKRQDQILKLTSFIQQQVYHMALMAHVGWDRSGADGI